MKNAARKVTPLRESYRAVKNVVYSVTTSNAKRDASGKFRHLSGLDRPYFVIGIPGSLHLLQLCLRYVPADNDVVLVSNGLDAWERDWASRQLTNVRSVISIGKMLRHGDLLDLIIRNYRQPFGILDYDCLVFDPALLRALGDIDSMSMFNAAYAYTNRTLNIQFPETFFLFLNGPLLLGLEEKYRVSSDIYAARSVPASVWKRLATIGIDRQHFPEEHKQYFDTLRLLVALGYADGYKGNFVEQIPAIPRPNHRLFHAGGAAYPGFPMDEWGTAGVYLWRRALDENPDAELKERYRAKYGGYGADEVLRASSRFVQSIGKDVFDFIDRTIDRQI
jgi:hypothetical protein